MTLHRHGLGRDEILALARPGVRGRLPRDADARSSSDPGPALERLRAALHAVCDVTERHLGFLLGLDEETDRAFFHELRARRALARRPTSRRSSGCCARGSPTARSASLDVGETATVLVNATDRTYRHLRGAHAWPEARARDLLVDLLLSGVR